MFVLSIILCTHSRPWLQRNADTVFEIDVTIISASGSPSSAIWNELVEDEHERIKQLEEKYSVMMENRQVRSEIA